MENFADRMEKQNYRIGKKNTQTYFVRFGLCVCVQFVMWKRYVTVYGISQSSTY